ncbi:hypothetical protein [Komagataeibacter europaeus]|uniref:hypothetical protein n=1 Tax=Komagataeibacter europaeus TaxID=33995 RepID=UPI0018DED6CF|nr:hypothetical protein [Komagataeibacter europaeus]
MKVAVLLFSGCIQNIRDCLKSWPEKTFSNHKEVFGEAFFKKLQKRRLFEKRQHPKTFINFSESII